MGRLDPHWRRIGLLLAVAACSTYGDAQSSDDPKADASTSSSSGGALTDASALSDSAILEAAVTADDSGSSCPVMPCAGGFCDTFERADPIALGWTYGGTLAKTDAVFKIARDFGAGPCNGTFFTSVTSNATVSTLASRFLARALAAPANAVDVAFDLAVEGSLSAVSGAARAFFVAVTAGATLDGTQPYVALAVKEGTFVLVGTNGGTTATSAMILTNTNLLQKVRIHFSTRGAESTIQFGDNHVVVSPLPSLGDDTKFTLLIGSALANAGALNLSVHFDNVVVTAL